MPDGCSGVGERYGQDSGFLCHPGRQAWLAQSENNSIGAPAFSGRCEGCLRAFGCRPVECGSHAPRLEAEPVFCEEGLCGQSSVLFWHTDRQAWLAATAGSKRGSRSPRRERASSFHPYIKNPRPPGGVRGFLGFPRSVSSYGSGPSWDRGYRVRRRPAPSRSPRGTNHHRPA